MKERYDVSYLLKFNQLRISIPTTLQQQSADLKGHLDRLSVTLLICKMRMQPNYVIYEKKGEQFDMDYKKICDEAPQVDHQHMGYFIDEWTDKLGRAYDPYKEKQDEAGANCYYTT